MRASDNKMEVGAHVEMGLPDRRQAALQAQDNDGVLDRYRRQRRFDGDDRHGFVAGRKKISLVRHEASPNRVDRADYPLRWIGNERGASPVTYVLASDLKGPCDKGVDEEELLLLRPVSEDVDGSFLSALLHVPDVLDDGNETCPVEPLMGALVGVEKKIQEHAIEGAHGPVDYLGDKDRLRCPFGKREIRRA